MEIKNFLESENKKMFSKEVLLNFTRIFSITAFLKIVAAALAFTTTVLITRNLNTIDAGDFLFCLTIITVLTNIFKFGLDNVAVRTVSAEGLTETVKLDLNRMYFTILILCLFISVIFILNAENISLILNKGASFSVNVMLISAILPIVTIVNFTSYIYQGIRKFTLCILFQGLLLSLIFLLTLYCTVFILDKELDDIISLKFYFSSSIVVFILSLYLFIKIIKKIKISFIDKKALKPAIHFWSATVMTVTVNWVAILMAGTLISSDDFARLSSAQRLANLVSFILIIINLIITPRFARLWKEKKMDELRTLSKWSSRLMFLFCLPIVILILLFSESIMDIYGSGYSQASMILCILVIGQFFNVVTGSVGYLLNMTGHEKDMNLIAFVSSIFSLVLAYVLIQKYGALGAAYATTGGVIFQNSLRLFYVKIRLGFMPVK